MKKMALNKTWEECLRMWKWIVERTNNRKYRDDTVIYLKRKWLIEHGYNPDLIVHYCFFCEAAIADNRILPCDGCPGRKVNSRFQCTNHTYFWKEYPHRFYKKLLELDAKRRSK